MNNCHSEVNQAEFEIVPSSTPVQWAIILDDNPETGQIRPWLCGYGEIGAVVPLLIHSIGEMRSRYPYTPATGKVYLRYADDRGSLMHGIGLDEAMTDAHTLLHNRFDGGANT